MMKANGALYLDNDWFKYGEEYDPLLQTHVIRDLDGVVQTWMRGRNPKRITNKALEDALCHTFNSAQVEVRSAMDRYICPCVSRKLHQEWMRSRRAHDTEGIVSDSSDERERVYYMNDGPGHDWQYEDHAGAQEWDRNGRYRF
jgi:hypothetical protein